MRRYWVLLVAAVAALFPVPAASAHGSPSSQDTPESCPPPEVVAQYHPDRFSVYVTLPLAGCPTRGNGGSSLSVWLDRVDEHTGEGHGRVVSCGPFSSSPGADTDSSTRADTCELDLVIPHPSPEEAYYDLAVTYPGADGEETLESHSFCTTGDDGAYCVEADAR
jgi:hypothetical protein